MEKKGGGGQGRKIIVIKEWKGRIKRIRENNSDKEWKDRETGIKERKMIVIGVEGKGERGKGKINVIKSGKEGRRG